MAERKSLWAQRKKKMGKIKDTLKRKEKKNVNQQIYMLTISKCYLIQKKEKKRKTKFEQHTLFAIIYKTFGIHLPENAGPKLELMLRLWLNTQWTLYLKRVWQKTFLLRILFWIRRNRRACSTHIQNTKIGVLTTIGISEYLNWIPFCIISVWIRLPFLYRHHSNEFF